MSQTWAKGHFRADRSAPPRPLRGLHPVPPATACPPLAALPGPIAASAPQPGPRRRSAPWAALASSGLLHASAALALAIAAPFSGLGSAGEEGQALHSLPPPPAMTVEIVSQADLLPATPPPAPVLDLQPMTTPLVEEPAATFAAASPLAPPADSLPPRMASLDPESAPVGDLPPPAPVVKAPVTPKPKADPAPKAKEPAKTPAGKLAKAPATPAPAPPAAKASGTGKGETAGQGGSAGAGLSKSEIADLKAAWGAKVQARVERRQTYPAEGGGASGMVKLQLTVAPSGALLGVTVTASSGSAALDRAALRAVQGAAPFPKAPRGLTEPGYRMALRLRFNG